jgi:hypothetical protein
MNKWWKYLNEVRTDNPPRKSVAGVKRSVGAIAQQGGQTKGSPYKTVKDPLPDKEDEDEMSAPPGAPGGLEEEGGYRKRVRRYTKDRNKMLNVGGQKNTAPYTQKMSSHVTFDRLEEEAEPESFEKQPELDPQFWQDCVLKPKVARRLQKIAYEFLDGLGVEADMVDLRFTGSLANYNWSKYSDIDLHLVVDFSKIDEGTQLVKELLDSVRMRWNELHDIMIYGHEVEIYVENVGEVHRSSGVYSILENKWIVSPSPDKIEFDYTTARKKADAIETEVNMIEKFASDRPSAALKSIERLKEKIRKMRKAGLHSSHQEYSAENIAFKILRREETLDKLNNMKYDAYDRVMSVIE